MHSVKLLSVVLAGICFVQAGARAQDVPDRPERIQRIPGRRFPGTASPSAGKQALPILKENKGVVYLMVGGFLAAFDAGSLEKLAEIDLEKESTAGGRSGQETGEDAFSRMDADGNGKLTPDEVRLPERVLERLDRDADGAVSRDEIPQFLLQRFEELAGRRSPVPSLPALEPARDGSVFVFYKGWLYKLHGRTLAVTAKVKVPLPEPERPERRNFPRRDDRRREPPQGAPDRFPPPEDNGGAPIF